MSVCSQAEVGSGMVPTDILDDEAEVAQDDAGVHLVVENLVLDEKLNE